MAADRAQDTEAIRAARGEADLEGVRHTIVAYVPCTHHTPYGCSKHEALAALDQADDERGRLAARLEAAERDVALCAADTTAPNLAQDIEFLKAEKVQMQERLDRKQETNRVLAVEQGRLMCAYAKARDELADVRAALAAAAPGETTVTHGRHCPCSACAREDWTRITGPCGMHGADCPAVYAPAAPGETEQTP